MNPMQNTTQEQFVSVISKQVEASQY